MDDHYMGKRCRFSAECHVYQGMVQLKQPLFLVKNIYCNNGHRWWNRCNIYRELSTGQKVEPSLLPNEDLRAG